MISSRLGLQKAAVEVSDRTNFWVEVMERRTRGQRVDYLICDEAQFYTPEQVEQLARLVDEVELDVFAFGITADFRTRLFPGSQRLIELADRVQVLQVEALCWCGRRATQNARTVNGIMVVEGAQVVVGDVDMARDSDAAHATGPAADVVGYETLCRRHYMRRVSAHAATMIDEQDQLLPFDVESLPRKDQPAAAAPWTSR